MAEPFDTLAEEVADVFARHHAGTITEAEMAEELSPLLAQLSPSLAELLVKISAFAGRVPGMLFFDGVPPADFGLVNAVSIDRVGKRIYGPKTEAGWGPPWTPENTGRSLENLFPNTEWQFTNGLGPGWSGDPGSLSAHFDAFDTEMNWAYTGNLPAVNVSNIAVATDGTSGQNTITATCDDVQYCYPGQIIIFGASGAHASLRVSPMRLLTVNVTTNTVTFRAPRNGSPTTGAVTCAFRPVMRADMAGVTGNGPDRWTKTAAAHCWLDRFPLNPAGLTGTPGWTSNLRPSNRRALVIRPTANTDQHFYHTFSDPISMRGQTINFGFLLDRVANGTAQLFIGGSDYVESATLLNTAGWAWLEMAYTVPDDCTELQAGIVFKNSDDAPWRIVDPMCVIGAVIGEGGYRRPPRGTIERFLVKQTPDSFHGADFSFGATGSPSVGYGFEVDLCGETGGAVAEDVPLFRGQIEGTPGAAGSALGVRNTFAAPQRFGMIAHCPVAGKVGGVTGDFDMHSDGRFWMFTQVSEAAFTDVSIDLNSAVPVL